MTFLTALYTLIIYPIELLFEIVFSIISKTSGNVVVSIIILTSGWSILLMRNTFLPWNIWMMSLMG